MKAKFHTERLAYAVLLGVGAGFTFSGCSGETGSLQAQAVESCMLCHNGALENDYSGPGVENPHPFAGADSIRCTTCHGGNPDGTDLATSHVPPPPQVGDEAHQTVDAKAYFNRLTLAGLDKYPNYTVAGQTHTALDFLQFVNPGDLRVVTRARGCGQCHANHAEDVGSSLLATEAGIFSGARFAAGAESIVPENAGLYEETASDIGWRAVSDAGFSLGGAETGSVSRLVEAPVYALFGVTGPDQAFNNPNYFAAAIADDRTPTNQLVAGSPLANLYHEQIAFTCGDCHLGSAGQNNRAGDFRSSGCTACHMPYSLGGKSSSSDPNVVKTEPVNPDAIDAPERSHPRTHQIRSVKQTTPSGHAVQGIDDWTCAGCHQGSNRTVMQYWGIRLDQNADLVRHVQYPANPVTFATTNGDTRLFDPAVGNNTFNGRNRNQYILREDYDGDGRDDTPADVHYEAGMGCIDCHGSFDMHGGDTSTPGFDIASRMEQQVGIRCESCHGTADAYADAVSGTARDGTTQMLAVDGKGHTLDHVVRQSAGNFYLTSRLTGAVHYIPQTKDTVVNTGKLNPLTNQPLYSGMASYAMGRADADPANGIGPLQANTAATGFSHTDRMDCVACHGSWTNTCMGCHLSGEYNTGNNFSNVTGERIVYKQRTADFTYQSPIYFQLGVNTRGRITQFSANTKVFYQWEDKNGDLSQRFTFTDRKGRGSDPGTTTPSMSHNSIMAHSVRGKVAATKEGPRYCVACHLTTEALTNYGTQYDAFRAAMASANYAALDFNFLKDHFGKNTGNQIDSPLWAHMAAGLGTGLFLFDANGAPVNPLDNDVNRKGADGVAPASIYDPARVALNLDRVVTPAGIALGSNNHTWLSPLTVDPTLRDGASDPTMAGPLGATLVERLSDPVNGIVLDSWIDANGVAHGSAATFIGP